LFKFIKKKLGITTTNKATVNNIQINGVSFDIDFANPTVNKDSIWWQATPKLHNLSDLSRSSLSGPIQEIKAEIREKILKTFLVETINEDVQLQNIGGLCANIIGDPNCASFEDFALSESCSKIKIISHRDFENNLKRALPNISNNNKPLNLVSAEWLNSRLFWQNNKHVTNFACAVVYARKRKIDLSFNAEINHYYVSTRALADLNANYHILSMPSTAWRNHHLMDVLFNESLPYARLPLLFDALILPKKNITSYKLGCSLVAAGACDIIPVIKQLITNKNHDQSRS